MADLMQMVNCLVALGGDKGNLVPKYFVSVPEMMVLREIHGADAVVDIEPAGEQPFDAGRLMEHLLHQYRRPDGVISPVRTLYPGSRPNIPLRLSDVGLDPAQLKAVTRVNIDGAGVEAVTVPVEVLNEAKAEAAAEKLALEDKIAELEAKLAATGTKRRARKTDEDGGETGGDKASVLD